MTSSKTVRQNERESTSSDRVALAQSLPKNADTSSVAGARIGLGKAFCVVKPGTIEEALEVLQACVLIHHQLLLKN